MVVEYKRITPSKYGTEWCAVVKINDKTKILHFHRYTPNPEKHCRKCELKKICGDKNNKEVCKKLKDQGSW